MFQSTHYWTENLVMLKIFEILSIPIMGRACVYLFSLNAPILSFVLVVFSTVLFIDIFFWLLISSSVLYSIIISILGDRIPWYTIEDSWGPNSMVTFLFELELSSKPFVYCSHCHLSINGPELKILYWQFFGVLYCLRKFATSLDYQSILLTKSLHFRLLLLINYLVIDDIYSRVDS